VTESTVPAGSRVLITGGLGMIGSTIARRLVDAGARVTLQDACIRPYGANHFNLREVEDRVTLQVADIRDREAMTSLVQGQDVIFNLAGQVSHNDSMADPFLDAQINYLGHLNVLENVRLHNPRAVVLHAGSRLQYGRIEQVPVNEQHPLNPRTPYALNKTAAENMYRFFADVHGLRCVLFRIANPFGPRSQMRHAKYSMVNWFIRRALDGEPLEVFGDGAQVRDYLYVEDLAEAFIAAAYAPAAYGEVFNVGSGRGTSFREMVRTVAEVVGQGDLVEVPWPEDYVHVETGDYVSDISRIRHRIGWAPVTPFREGLERTVAFYREFRAHYW